MPYFILTIVLLLIEIFIALFVHDSLIRPYFGDFLVVILVYCFLRSFFNLSVKKAAIFSLLFSFLVELVQNFGIAKYLDPQNRYFAGTVIGTSFSPVDLLMYTLGIIAVLLIEKIVDKRKVSANKLVS